MGIESIFGAGIINSKLTLPWLVLEAVKVRRFTECGEASLMLEESSIGNIKLG
jgi:hypothetical protein